MDSTGKTYPGHFSLGIFAALMLQGARTHSARLVDKPATVQGWFNLGSSLATNQGIVKVALFCLWDYLIYYRNNNNKAETFVTKVEKWLSILFIQVENDM